MKNYEILATKIMINALEGVKAQIRKAYDKGYKDGQESLVNAYAIGKGENILEDVKKAEYNRGLNDAWDAAKWLYNNPIDLEEDIFNCDIWEIYSKYTAQEVVHKIKAYEDKQKQDAEIKVGDEIVYSDGIKGVVVGISNTVGQISVLNNKYDVPQLLVKNRAKKTGRTFPQIAEALAELRGAENDE